MIDYIINQWTQNYQKRKELNMGCNLALQRLGMQTYELQLEEYTYLNLLLGVRLSLQCLQVVVTQTGDQDSTLGGNHYQSSRSG